MTKGAPRTAAVSRSRARIYWRRGQNLIRAMAFAENAGNLDGIAICGVQAAVSLGDAFTVSRLGLRSRGRDHGESVRLIATVEATQAARLASLVQRVLNKKSEVEYGDREVTRPEAAEIATLAREIEAVVAPDFA